MISRTCERGFNHDRRAESQSSLARLWNIHVSLGRFVTILYDIYYNRLLFIRREN